MILMIYSLGGVLVQPDQIPCSAEMEMAFKNMADLLFHKLAKFSVSH